MYGKVKLPKLACLFALCCALVCGCAKKDAKSQAAGAVAPVEKTAERGPVKLVVRVAKGTITIAEKVNLRIEAVAAGGVDVEMPSFGNKLNEFDIMDFRERVDLPVDSKSTGSTGGVGGTGGQAAGGTKSESASGARKWTQEYVLQTFLSGEQEIPAITVKFRDKRDPNKAIDGEVTSEPFKIKVASLLAGEFDPKKYRDIKGTVDLPVDRGRAWIWWTAGGTGTAIVVVALVLWLRSRRRRVAMPKPLPPHEWAFFALQRLEEDRLIEEGRVQEFYYRLSGIVREYIERRFGLMAPERTTPEFLVEVRGSAVLSGEHKRLLTDFLQAADMVKFARYEPATSEVAGSLTTARAFVDQTTSISDNGHLQSLGIPIPGNIKPELAETAEVTR